MYNNTYEVIHIFIASVGNVLKDILVTFMCRFKKNISTAFLGRLGLGFFPKISSSK